MSQSYVLYFSSSRGGRDLARRLVVRAEIVVESLKNRCSLLVSVVELDLLVLVSKKLLHVDSALFCNSQHDLALCRNGIVRKFPCLKLQLPALISLLLSHLLLLSNCAFECVQI